MRSAGRGENFQMDALIFVMRKEILEGFCARQPLLLDVIVLLLINVGMGRVVRGFIEVNKLQPDHLGKSS